LGTYGLIELTSGFRRTFVLAEKPATATLVWRCLARGQVYINNTSVTASSPGNWKAVARVEIGPYLRPGTNEIFVSVTNKSGPPALSLKLQTVNLLLVSDETWDASMTASNWRAAQLASVVPDPKKGSDLYLLETTGGALRRCWPWLGLFSAISIGGVAVLNFYPGRAKMIFLLLAVAWAVLLLHNVPWMPPAMGFDAEEHLAYVSFIQLHHQLPDAREGREMFQPPLYYIISAKLLDLVHCEAPQPAGMMVIRYLGVGVGAVTLAFVFAALRLIFPGDWRKPRAGTILAAFLPAQLYLLHYPTNETFAAMCATGALWAGLGLLRTGPPRWGLHFVLGIFLGLAMLSKSSTVVVVLSILGALAVKLMMRGEKSALVWVRAIGLPLMVCVAIAGWRYFGLWREFGNPFIGGWDARVAAPWWQYKGLQTPGYFFSLGQALTHPFFAGLRGYWGGLYSTLWGDGMWGGKVFIWGRPPWNYDLMTAGYVLAVIPTVLVLTGLGRAVMGCFRAAALSWLLLLAVGGLLFFAILGMNLKFPFYGHAKAFFGLAALLPLCACGALGFEFWADRGRVARCVLGFALGLWLVNLYASLWITPNTADTELSWAIASESYVAGDGAAAFSRMQQDYPDDIRTTVCLALTQVEKHPDQALKYLEQAAEKDPRNGRLELAMAEDLMLEKRLDEALPHAKRAVELGPEDELALKLCCDLASHRGDYEAAIEVGLELLNLNPTDLPTYFALGMSFMNLGQYGQAIRCFSPVIEARPGSAMTHYCLGVCLLNQSGRRPEALDHLQEAVRLEPDKAEWKTVLQNALKAP
jgi:tetratricopeptide (TPR) repeat protein